MSLTLKGDLNSRFVINLVNNANKAGLDVINSSDILQQ
ncbi:hypothetical protein swp_1924 [Shewanella piezotolerans WP3]|uniref:Uncharacterized protein n=1 Tax=Shewanella piezotolerans (strain WP3 / JCM 13877) TaxID=225849 RepID=B8CLN2_SHEPW|nr:hypothetical protein swp_1924 [Shewanella piezotolerans WP3]